MGTCISMCCCHLCDKKECIVKSNCCKKIWIKASQKNLQNTKLNININ